MTEEKSNEELKEEINQLNEKIDDVERNYQFLAKDLLMTLKNTRPTLSKKQQTLLAKYVIRACYLDGWRPIDIVDLVQDRFNLATKRFVFKYLKEIKSNGGKNE